MTQPVTDRGAPRVLVIDDSSDKWDLAVQAARLVPDGLRPEVRWADQRGLTGGIPDFGVNLAAQELAEYDLVLIDFELRARRYLSAGPRVTLDLPVGGVAALSGPHTAELTRMRREEIELTTGLGVLLHLTQALAKEDYLRARGDRRLPRLCMYGDFDEAPTRFSAALGTLLFDSPWFPVDKDLRRRAYRLERLLAEVRGVAPTPWVDAFAHLGVDPARRAEPWVDPFARLVRNAVRELEGLLFPFEGKRVPEWVRRPDGLSGFLWLRSVLENRGAAGPEEYRADGLINPVPPGKGSPWPNPTDLLYAKHLDPMYAHLKAFAGAFLDDHIDEWPPSRREWEEDPGCRTLPSRALPSAVRAQMHTVLSASKDIWRREGDPEDEDAYLLSDVECALRWYLARTGPRLFVALPTEGGVDDAAADGADAGASTALADAERKNKAWRRELFRTGPRKDRSDGKG